MKRFVFCFFALICGAAIARADVVPASFGTPQLLWPQQTAVQLESETFRARIFFAYCEAEATYIFRNRGGATTVRMGFREAGPEMNFSPDTPGFSRFALTLDGQPLNSTAFRGGKTYYDEVFQRLAKISFAPGQRREIRLRARTHPFQSLLFDGDLNYVFGGARWSGPVRKSEVSVQFAAPNTYLVSGYYGTRQFFEEKDQIPVEYRVATAIFRRENWRPTGRFNLVFPVIAFPKWLSETGIEKAKKSIVVRGQSQGLQGAAIALPSALVREGHTFARLDWLLEKMALSEKEQQEAENYLIPGSPSTPVILRARKSRLEFWRGQRGWRWNRKSLTLPAAPFVESEISHDSGEYKVLYVPLFPVVKALGGQANVNQKAHRIWISFPHLK